MTEPQVSQNRSGLTAVEQGSNIPLGWKPTAAEPVPVVRCVTIKKDGERCKRWSLRGYDKCYRHSGSGNLKNVEKYADAVVEAARLRLIGNTDTAVDVLEQLMQPGTAEGVRLKAATEVLDRSGVRGGFEVQVEGEVKHSPAEEIQKRLDKLAQGAQAVESMRSRIRRAHADPDADEDVVDAEIIDDDDDEHQPALFELDGDTDVSE
jgi:hypothetical protein